MDLPKVRILYAELLQLALHQPEGEPCPVDGDVELPKHVRESSHVVLVAVGEAYPADLVRVLPKVGEVRQDEVYPRHLFVRESQASVHQDHAAVLPHGGHVLADFVQAP
jgi:hypothetical protein